MAKDVGHPKMGRPTTYNDKLIDTFLDRIMDGRGLVSVCKDPDMPRKSTVYQWLADSEKKDFVDRYIKACKIRAEVIAENMIDKIESVELDKDAIAQARLELDAKKWFLAKLHPTKYGDKPDDSADQKDQDTSPVVVNINVKDASKDA